MEKDISDFHKCAQRKDGLSNHCIACYEEWRKQYVATHKEQVKLWARRGNAKSAADPRNREKRISKAYLWRLEHPERAILVCIKSKAKKNNIAFDLEVKDIHIPKQCPVLGVTLVKGQRRIGNSASVDRIDPSVGYVKGNIQIMSSKANVMKNNATPKELLKFAEWVMKTYGATPIPK